jgi:hypothetical protein
VKKLAIIISALLSAASCLNAQEQVLEVQQTSGFAEALLENLGWRQAVIGRQLPAGSAVTSWLDAEAKLGYRDSIVTVEQLSHITVVDISADLVRLSLEAGGVRVDSAAITYEVRFHGMVIRIEKGTAVLSDGVLKAEAGTVTVSGAQDGPMVIHAGSSVNLLAPAHGPVFPALPD